MNTPTTLPYYRWTNNIGETFSHVGVLTNESEDQITLLTKFGEMTFPRNEGTFDEATRSEFELVEVPVAVETVQVKETKSGSRTETAADIISNMPGVDKKTIIDALVAQMNITRGNASIYYSKLTK